MSKASSPGIVLATGNIGTKIHIDRETGMFVSADGGWTWHGVSVSTKVNNEIKLTMKSYQNTLFHIGSKH